MSNETTKRIGIKPAQESLEDLVMEASAAEEQSQHESSPEPEADFVEDAQQQFSPEQEAAIEMMLTDALGDIVGDALDVLYVKLMCARVTEGERKRLGPPTKIVLDHYLPRLLNHPMFGVWGPLIITSLLMTAPRLKQVRADRRQQEAAPIPAEHVPQENDNVKAQSE